MSDVARPGDVLLVPIPEGLSRELGRSMEEMIKLYCPDLKKVIFYPGHGSITIYRPAGGPY